MTRNMRDITFATFNLYNLQRPGEPWRGSTPYTQAEYDAKVAWSAERLRALDADVIAFQELWSPQCLRDVFDRARLSAEYELAFIGDGGWYDIAVAAAVRAPWEIRGRRVIKDFPEGFVLRKREVDRAGGNEDPDDDIEVLIRVFSRSVLQLTIGHRDAPEVPPIEVP